MNRRGFIKRAGLLIATAIATPSALLHFPSAPAAVVVPSVASAESCMFMSIKEFSEKYVKPAAQMLAEKMDEDILTYTKYNKIHSINKPIVIRIRKPEKFKLKKGN